MDLITSMEMQVNGVLLGCIFGFIGIILFCFKIISEEKFKKKIFAAMSFLCAGSSILVILGAIFKSEKLSLSVIILIGVSEFLYYVKDRYTYKKCDGMVTGVLKDYRMVGRRVPRAYMAIYTLEYNGKKYEVNDLRAYYRHKFFKLFKVGNPYNVYINPKYPSEVCVYKDTKNYDAVFGFIFSAIVTFFGVLVVIVA